MPHDLHHDPHHDSEHGHGHEGAHDHGEAFPRIEVAERVAKQEQRRAPTSLRAALPALFVAMALALFALALPTEGVDAGVIEFVEGAAADDSVVTHSGAQKWVRRLGRAFDVRLERAAFLLAAIAFGATLLPALFAARTLGLSRGMRWLAAGTLFTTLAAWLAGTRPHDSALGLLASTLLFATLASRTRGVGSALLATAVWFWGANQYAPVVLLFPALLLAITASVWRQRSLWLAAVPVLALALHALRDLGSVRLLTPTSIERASLESTPALFGLDGGWIFLLAPGWLLVACLALVARRRGDELHSRAPAWMLAWLAVPVIAVPWRQGLVLDGWTVLLPLCLPGAAALATLLGDASARRALVVAVTAQVVILLALLVHGRMERPVWLTASELLLERDDLVITRDPPLRYLLRRRYGLRVTRPGDTQGIAKALESKTGRIVVDAECREHPDLPVELRPGSLDPERVFVLPARDE